MAIAKAEILDAIANMTVLELSELIKEMEEKFGVSAAAAAVANGLPVAEKLGKGKLPNRLRVWLCIWRCISIKALALCSR